MGLDTSEALRLQALQAVVCHRTQRKSAPVDPGYVVRSILRWYSKTYFTPLHEVEELPFDDILQCYYEEHYEALPEQELEEERLRLTEDEDEVRKRQAVEDADDADLWGFTKSEPDHRSLEGSVVKPKDSSITSFRPMTKESELIPKDKLEPEAIAMTFRDLDEDEDSVGFGLLDRPRK